jgi:hypothetical protein
VDALFDKEEIGGALGAHRKPREAVGAFAGVQAEELDALRDRVGEHLAERLATHNADVEEALREGTRHWPPANRQAVLDADAGFSHWDVLLYPLRQVSETGELDPVQVVRLSPLEVDRLHAREGHHEVRGPAKLAGVKAAHFGAFFSRDRRENDYLWGRLDAAEWILRLLLGDDPPPPALTADAFGAVLASEERLTKVRGLRSELADQVDKLRSASGTPG